MSSLRSIWTWAVQQPIAWAATLMGFSTLVAVTGRSTSDPTRSLAISMIGGGVSLAIVALASRQWRLHLAAGGLIGWGAGVVVAPDVLLSGGMSAIILLGAAVLVLVLVSDRFVARVSAAILAGIGASMAFFDLDLLALVTSVAGLFATAAWTIGLDRARQEGVDTGLTSASVFEYAGEWWDARWELAEDVDALHAKLLFEGPDARRRMARFHMLMGFAAAIASLGVLTDSTAVVIGAMLIAPLMTPLMATSLSLVMGSSRRLGRSLGLAGSGSVLAIATGVLMSAIAGLGTDVASNTQIASRITPTLLDLAIAVAAGAAGAYALSRRDVSDSLPGVAVAIALVPPLTVVGIAAQLGEWSASLGALTLFLTNALAIFGMGALTFMLTGTARAGRVGAEHPVIRQVSMVIVVAGVVVLTVLLVNGRTLSRAEFREDRADAVVTDWIGERSYQLGSVTVEGTEVVVEISGEDAPDDIAALAESLADTFESDVSLEVRFTPQVIGEEAATFAG